MNKYLSVIATCICCFVCTICLVFGIIDKKNIKDIKNDVRAVRIDVSKMRTKISLRDNVFRKGDYLWYVPDYPNEAYQNLVVEGNDLFIELNNLQKLDEFLPQNAVIVDVGANIGNNTIYWAKESPKKVKHVYAFEVFEDTFKLLKKNVELNKLTDKVTLFDCGLGAHNIKASVDHSLITDGVFSNGTVSVKEDSNGDLKLKRLDDIKFNHDKIDFLKIDVEGMEVDVVKGGMKFLKKYKPTIYVEIWREDDPSKYIEEIKQKAPNKVFGQRKEFDKLMKELGYEEVADIDGSNFIYQHQSKINK